MLCAERESRPIVQRAMYQTGAVGRGNRHPLRDALLVHLTRDPCNKQGIYSLGLPLLLALLPLQPAPLLLSLLPLPPEPLSLCDLGGRLPAVPPTVGTIPATIIVVVLAFCLGLRLGFGLGVDSVLEAREVHVHGTSVAT